MKAAHLQDFGGPAQVQVGDLPDPRPGAGEVLVRVRAAGVGPWDLAVAAGAFGPQGGFPVILGADVAGEVVALGQDVAGVGVGDRVMAFAGFSGAWAELQSVPLASLAPAPANASDGEAAALPVCGSTAHQAVIDGLAIGTGDTVVVLGAGGVVGSFAVQIAADRGARVLGTCGPQDVERLTGLGAQVLADYHADWVAALREAVPDGADGVLDLVGGDTTTLAFSLLRDGAAMVSTVQGPQPEAPRGIRWSFQGTQAEPDRLAQLAELVDQGRLVVEIGQVYPLTEAGQALAAVAGSHPAGKIVVEMG